MFHHYISLGSGKLVLFFFVKLVLNVFCRRLLHVSNSFDLKSDFDFFMSFRRNFAGITFKDLQIFEFAYVSLCVP